MDNKEEFAEELCEAIRNGASHSDVITMLEAAIAQQGDRPETPDRTQWTAHQVLEHELNTIQATIETFESPYSAMRALIDFHCKAYEQQVEQPTAPAEQWISCRDKLPDNDEIVWPWYPGDCHEFKSGPCTGAFMKLIANEYRGAKWLPTNLKLPAPPEK